MLSSEAVLDALKMILLDAPLHEVLRSLALLIEAQTKACCARFSCSRKTVYTFDMEPPRACRRPTGRRRTTSLSVPIPARAALPRIFAKPSSPSTYFVTRAGRTSETSPRRGIARGLVEPHPLPRRQCAGHFRHALPRSTHSTPREIQLIDDASRIAGIAIERERAQAGLKTAFAEVTKSEGQLRQMVDAIPQTVVMLGPDGSILYANRRVLAYTGLTEQEVMLTDFRPQVFHPDDMDRLRERRTAGFASGVPWENEVRVRRNDGAYRWFLISYNPLLDEHGAIVRWCAAGTDIEDRKRSEERLREENLVLREEIDRSSMFEEIVGSSAPLRSVLAQVAKVAPTDSTVLILGETGTGKELIARAIHKLSKRSRRAFIRVNCAAIPPSLIASELFGHEKGAFTGAFQRRLGHFEAAHGGTIFLDEIGELPAETQVALLRVLQEREFERVGSSQPVSVDVRVLAATNRELEAAVTAGTFRKDLFYRLHVFPIYVPSLRERRDDIPLLVEYLVERYARRSGKRIRHIHKKTLDLLQAYDWPGNIREMQNIIERAVILCDGEGEPFSVDETWLQRKSSPLPARRFSQAGILAEDKQELVERERKAIEAALAECQGRVSGPGGAAAKLGIPHQTLESKIARFGIDKRRFKSRPSSQGSA